MVKIAHARQVPGTNTNTLQGSNAAPTNGNNATSASGYCNCNCTIGGCCRQVTENVMAYAPGAHRNS